MAGRPDARAGCFIWTIANHVSAHTAARRVQTVVQGVKCCLKCKGPWRLAFASPFTRARACAARVAHRVALTKPRCCSHPNILARPPAAVPMPAKSNPTMFSGVKAQYLPACNTGPPPPPPRPPPPPPSAPLPPNWHHTGPLTCQENDYFPMLPTFHIIGTSAGLLFGAAAPCAAAIARARARSGWCGVARGMLLLGGAPVLTGERCFFACCAGNVTQAKDGSINLEPINDASGVTYYNGLYHVWYARPCLPPPLWFAHLLPSPAYNNHNLPLACAPISPALRCVPELTGDSWGVLYCPQTFPRHQCCKFDRPQRPSALQLARPVCPTPAPLRRAPVDAAPASIDPTPYP